MTDETFRRGMALMVAAWPTRNATADTFTVYRHVLRSLHDSVFEAAVDECLRSCKFFPAPAEIIAKSEQLLAVSGLLPAEGEDAWATVLRARNDWHPDLGWIGVVSGHERLGRVGGVGCNLPPLIKQALEAIGGMSRVWQADDHDLGFIRKEFLGFYDHKREQEMAYGPSLLGQALPERSLTLLPSVAA